jgi:methylated-DNA-protein-cysteine methyltransferase related protein
MKGDGMPPKHRPAPADPPESVRLYDRIYTCAGAVPPGYVTTYGTIGKIIGCPARVVGYAMHFLSSADRPEVPWQRVINAQGRISTHGDEQRRLLEAEGVIFDESGRVDLQRFGWQFTEQFDSLDLSDLVET